MPTKMYPPETAVRQAAATNYSESPTAESTPRRKILDWLSKDLPADYLLTTFQQFIRNINWEKSPLGPIEGWPNQLRQMVLLIVADPSPAVVYWGDDMTIVYNEAYTHLIGNKHPALQGQDPKIGFAEIWNQFDKIIRTGAETGLAHVGEKQMLLLARYGFLEETYYSWKFTPMVGLEGYVVGSYATVIEVTKEVISDRRLSFMLQLSVQIAKANDLNTFWPNLLEGFEKNDKDIPVALLYSSEIDFGKNAKEADKKPRECLLKGSLGFPDGHVGAPKTIKLEDDNVGFAPAMRESLRSGDVVLLQTKDGSLDVNMLSDLQFRGFGAPQQVVICPIRSMAHETLGFMVLGLNPRKPFSSDYESFIDALMKQVVSPSYISSILLSERVRRTEEDRAMLSKELIARTKAFEKSETKFLDFADRCPVAVVIVATDGVVLYANEPWYSLTMVDPKNTEERMAWLKNIISEDQGYISNWWYKVTEQKLSGTFPFRTKKPYIGYSAAGTRMESSFSTGMCTAYPTFDDEGNVETIIGIIPDVSELTWTASSLQTRMEEALNMKNQQEKFMDMISHEIRNPLSAMLHCSEGMIASLSGCLGGTNIDETVQPNLAVSYVDVPICHGKVLQEGIESAKTIVYCIEHQRRVVDDVLMLSKLDSDLLTVSLCPVQPKAMVNEALKMFEAELKKADITLRVVEDSSLHDLNADWVSLDQSRVLQVILNFLTNAIKFTRTQETRQITVRTSASLEKPSEGHNGTKYLPLRPRPMTMPNFEPTDTMLKDRSTENANNDLYLSFSVTDTGKGLSDSERKILFERFAQATPKTSSVYGGSGLGLFIARQIAELLGGAIGVTSELNKGSSFEFFVKTQRESEPGGKSFMEAQIPPSLKASLDFLASDTHATDVEEESMAGAEGAVTLTQASTGQAWLVNILVVEDNVINQKVASTQLRKLGYKVEVANNGLEALEKLTTTSSTEKSNQKFDVVLMDLEMPVMGGLECVKSIRKLEREGTLSGHVPVIAVTANVRGTHIESAIEAGMDGVTTKPYRMQDLVMQIEQARKISFLGST